MDSTNHTITMPVSDYEALNKAKDKLFLENKRLESIIKRRNNTLSEIERIIELQSMHRIDRLTEIRDILVDAKSTHTQDGGQE